MLLQAVNGMRTCYQRLTAETKKAIANAYKKRDDALTQMREAQEKFAEFSKNNSIEAYF